MSGGGSKRWTGTGWVALIAVPPLIIVVGLVVFFGWQVRKGTITPKWKSKALTTNQVPAAGTPR